MNARVLVPWKSVRDAFGDLGGLADSGLTVEVFTGDAPGPADLGDVVFFTVPYDRPFNTEPIPRLSGVRVVQALTAGYDHLAGLLPGGVTLCTARGLHALIIEAASRVGCERVLSEDLNTGQVIHGVHLKNPFA